MVDTGYPHADAQSDFQRQRRRQVLSQLAARLRREPDDVSEVLPYDEVVAALGYLGERPLGLQAIPLDAIVGSVDRAADFDRWFRPRARVSRQRWERLDRVLREGEGLPPIDVFRVGELYFVRDGHHRVSVALALGNSVIEAHVTEVLTQIPAAGISQRGDLVVKGYERLFRQRVPLPDDIAARIVCRDPWNYAELSENVEAWSFRLVQDAGEYLSRAEAARRWYEEEYTPVVAMLHEAALVGSGTEAEAYLRVACDRYRLIRAHEWSDDIVARLRG